MINPLHWVALGAVALMAVGLSAAFGNPVASAAYIFAKLLDPVTLIGTIAAGVLCRRASHLYIALGVLGLGLAIAVATMAPGLAGKALAANSLAQVAAVLMAGMAIYGIATQIRRNREPPKEPKE